MELEEAIKRVKKLKYVFTSNINDKEAIDIVLKELDKAKDLNEELQIRYTIEHEKYLKEKERNGV